MQFVRMFQSVIPCHNLFRQNIFLVFVKSVRTLASWCGHACEAAFGSELTIQAVKTKESNYVACTIPDLQQYPLTLGSSDNLQKLQWCWSIWLLLPMHPKLSCGHRSEGRHENPLGTKGNISQQERKLRQDAEKQWGWPLFFHWEKWMFTQQRHVKASERKHLRFLNAKLKSQGRVQSEMFHWTTGKCLSLSWTSLGSRSCGVFCFGAGGNLREKCSSLSHLSAFLFLEPVERKVAPVFNFDSDKEILSIASAFLLSITLLVSLRLFHPRANLGAGKTRAQHLVLLAEMSGVFETPAPSCPVLPLPEPSPRTLLRRSEAQGWNCLLLWWTRLPITHCFVATRSFFAK